MKAAIYNPNITNDGYLSAVDLEKPVLKENNTIVRILGVGVCGSDLLKLERALVKPGTILGHELVGIIDEISETMSSRYAFKKGDRIISSHHVPCLSCSYCLNGQESLCKQFKSTNFYPGAFCEYLELSEQHLQHTVLKVPEPLSNEEASFTEPVACCIKAIEKSGILSYRGKAKALVLGLSSIGQIMGQLVKALRESQQDTIELIGCDLQDYKRELALENGFDEAKPELNKEQADFVFLCAGANITVDLALANIKDGGTIVVFASVPDAGRSFSNNDIYYRELKITGSYSPNLANLRQALELLASGKLKVNNLITHRARLDNLGKVIKGCQQEHGIKSYLDLTSTAFD